MRGINIGGYYRSLQYGTFSFVGYSLHITIRRENQNILYLFELGELNWKSRVSLLQREEGGRCSGPSARVTAVALGRSQLVVHWRRLKRNASVQCTRSWSEVFFSSQLFNVIIQSTVIVNLMSNFIRSLIEAWYSIRSVLNYIFKYSWKLYDSTKVSACILKSWGVQ